MDSAANIIIAGPVLVDVMVKAGYPDVQAALVVVVGFLIGSVTPPVGVAFFTAGAIANVRLEKVAVAMLPFLVGAICVVVFADHCSRLYNVFAAPPRVFQLMHRTALIFAQARRSTFTC